MTTMRIDLSDEQAHRLEQMAMRLGVDPGILVQISVRQMLAQPDKAFEEAASEVLEKNAELYRRLA